MMNQGRMSKLVFVEEYLTACLQQADVDILRLKLIDNDHIEVLFEGGGKRIVNITGDSRKAIIIDVLKICD